jgi:tetratricopeptide (TPR) repeat protein
MMPAIALVLAAAVFPTQGKADPLEARLDYALAVRAELRREPERAARLREKALGGMPDAVRLVTEVAADRLAAGDFDGALSLHRELSQRRPDDVPAREAYLLFLLRHGSDDAAARALAIEGIRQLLERRPGDAEWLDRLIGLHFQAGQTEEARRWHGKIAGTDPAATLLYASWWRRLHPAAGTGREELDERFLAAMRAHPGHPALARAASDHFRVGGRMAEAIELLQTHAAANPASLDLRVRLGILLFSARRDDEALAQFAALLDIHPDHALAHQSLAKFHRMRGDAALARHHAGERLRLRGGSADEYLEAAEALLTAGEVVPARILLEKASREHPDDPAVAARLAVATRRDPATRSRAAGRFLLAEKLLPADQPADPEFLSETAAACIDAGQTERAEELLRRAIRAFPADASAPSAAAMRRLAGLWQEQGRHADAAAALLRRANDLDPAPPTP